MYLNSFHPHDDPLRWMIVLPPYFRGEGSEAQRSQVASPRSPGWGVAEPAPSLLPQVTYINTFNYFYIYI